MKVRCVACGKEIEVRTRFDRCPSCKRPAFKILKDLIDKSQQPAESELPEEDLDPSPLDDFAAEPAETPAPYVPHQGGSGIEIKIAKIVGITIVSVILLVILIDYVRTKARQTSSNSQTPVTTVAPPPTIRTAPDTSETPETPPEQAVPVVVPVAPVKPTSKPAPLIFHPVAVEIPKEKIPLNDAAIRKSIENGITFLLKNFDSTGKIIDPTGPDDTVGGRHALCLLALLHAGQSTQDRRLPISGKTVVDMIEQLKRYKMDGGPATYSRSLRISALAVHNRTSDRPTIQGDVAYLLKSTYKGAFTYYLDPNRDPKSDTPISWDNSNTQYGQMGLWLAADSGALVPASFWADVQRHWIDCQAPATGGFEYNKATQGTLSMTAAGLTMMLVADEQLYGDAWASTTRPKQATDIHDAIQKAMEWMSKGDTIVKIGSFYGYTLYGIERAGLASGFRWFGTHDWYSELATQVLERQKENGSWEGETGPLCETAFALLFLSRGRHPVMMNKLMFEGTWANRPRDAAHLAKFTSEELERPLNWQVVGIDHPWEEWTDCPILYIASHEAPQFTDAQIEKIKSFAYSGGVVLTHADNGSEEFNIAARMLAAKMFPQFPLKALPENHFIYSIGFPVDKKPPLEAVSNGTRLLMIHSPTDISKMWQRHDSKAFLGAFRLGANLFVYATGKEPPRQRMETAVIPDYPAKTVGTIPIARLKYNGNWDPEPFAWTQLTRLFKRDTSIALSVHPVELAALTTGDARVAHLTGTDAVALDEKQAAAIHQYVNDGGVLIVDACAGAAAFSQSIRDALAKIFPETPTILDASSPILAGSGEGMVDVSKPILRSFAVVSSRENPPQLEMIQSGRGCVIFSDYDLTCGWLGTRIWGIRGYDPTYAQNLGKNLILWAINIHAVEAAKAAP